jgi:Rod binding domain-containing protein
MCPRKHMDNGIKIGIPGSLDGAGMVNRLSREKEGDRSKAAHDFESYLNFTVLKELEKVTHVSKKSQIEQTYMSVVYEKVAECLAKKGIGIKEMLNKYNERTNVKVSDPKGDNTVK